jgi:membrane protein YqaA with SNARE-associated domain
LPGSSLAAQPLDSAVLKSILVISIGAAIGAVLRWALGLKLNTLLPELPPGTPRHRIGSHDVRRHRLLRLGQWNLK